MNDSFISIYLIDKMEIRSRFLKNEALRRKGKMICEDICIFKNV